MATQVIGSVRRSRIGVILIAVALTFAVAMLVTQASSIWSEGSASPVRPGPVHVSLSAKDLRDLRDLSAGAHVPDDCRVKFGCEGGRTQGRP
jgi:hypothetical protein